MTDDGNGDDDDHNNDNDNSNCPNSGNDDDDKCQCNEGGSPAVVKGGWVMVTNLCTLNTFSFPELTQSQLTCGATNLILSGILASCALWSCCCLLYFWPVRC